MGGASNEPEMISSMYRKTHGNFAPGEQKNRDYDWKFDPTQHRFGYGEKKVLNGAAMALQNERLEEAFPKTVIVRKTVEDHKGVASDMLGVSKNLGQGQTNRGADFVHGIRNVQGSNPWNAARCIHGEPTELMMAPDKDLGKSVKPNCRNVVRKEEDMHRSFGLPTIRKDIPYKDFRSVADYQVSFLTVILFFCRTMETNLRLSTFSSHLATRKLASKKLTLEDFALELKLRHSLARLDMTTKLVNLTRCIIEQRRSDKLKTIEFP